MSTFRRGRYLWNPATLGLYSIFSQPEFTAPASMSLQFILWPYNSFKSHPCLVLDAAKIS